MNKIYKVIWNEARNAYVVVSEIAKNHGSKSCSTKKLLAMLIATGVMTCASVAPAIAANLAPTETKIEIGEDASASGEGSVAIGRKAVASNLVAIAIGRDAVASGVDSIAIGSDTKATQMYSVAVGNDIGFTAYAGTAVGQQAYASGDNATAIGTMTNVDAEYKASHGDWRKAGEQSTAIGAYAGSWGVSSTAVGGFSKAEGKLATAIGYNSQANVDYGTALGDYSKVKAGWGVAIGASSFADRESHVVGLYAPDEDKDSLTWKANAGAVSVGSSVEGQEITRQITNVAAGSADTDAVNVAQLNAVKAAAGKKVSLVDGENTKATLVKDDATGTQYKVDVDLSKYAKTEDVAVVYDKNKTSLRSTNASVAENAIALGKDASAVKDGGVALGNEAHAGNKGTSLGTKAKSGREGATVVGYNTNSSGLYSTVVGTDAVINTDGTAYQTPFKDVIVQGAAATVVGSKNTVDNQNNKVYSGVANNVMGSANTIEGSNGVTIQGTGNKVTDAYKDMNITTNEGLAILGGDYSVLAKKQSGAVAVVGGANTVSKQTDSTVIGYDNQLIGGEENISHDVFMAGSHNRLNNVSDSIVMGNENAITGVSNVISFGHKNAITANNAVAIGNGAGVSVEGGVALGVGSVASTDAGALGYGAAEGETGIAWKATNGAVSVGSSVEGKKITRQITNVAAGTEDTDAVNVAQLKKVSEAAASASQGWKLKTQNGNASDVKPGATVEFDGDANIQVGNDGNKVSVTLKDTLTGITSITGAGEGAGSISFADGGIKFNNKVTIDNTGKISGVANGIADNDAVNVSQLNKVSAAAKTEVVKGTNIASVVASNATDDGHTVYTVNAKGTSVSVDGNFNLNTTTDDETNVTNYGISLKDSVAIGGTHAVTINGTDGTVTGLTNTTWNKDSITSGRAATEDQLQAVATEAGKHTTLSDGKNTKVKLVTTADSHLEYKVDVNDELKNIKSISNGDKTISLDGTALLLKNGDATLAIAKGAAGMQNGAGASVVLNGTQTVINGGVTFDHTGKITHVAEGVADTDAVNVGQLKKFVSEGNTDSHIKAGEYEVGADNKVSMDIVDKNGQSTGEKVTIKDVAKASDVGDVSKIDKDIQNKEGNTTVVDAVNNVNNKVGDLNYSQVAKGDLVNGDNTTTAIGKLNQKLSDVEKTAGAHSTVSTDDSGNISVTPTKDEKTGVTDYKVSLNKDLKLDSVKVGENVSLTKDGLTAGDTKVTNAGLSIGDKTYVTKDGLNANGNKVTHVADGKVEKGSTDAVNGGQLYNETRVAKDGNFVKKSNTAGENLSALDNQVTANMESIYHMNGRISDLDNRVNKVGAGAAALAALHPLDFDPDAKWDFAAGYGNYRGANAAAVGAYYRPNEDTMFSVGGTFGNGENMVNAGVSFKLGSGSSHVSTSRVAMAKEIKELRGELEAMKSAMLDANAGKKIDTSKLQLFPDVPQNHWAYEYVAQLAGNGMIEGYPDGNFAGDRPMTRYEFAAILYRAMTKGAVLSDKILSEFSHELEYFTVDTIAKDKAGNPTIQRVRTVKENKNK